MAKYEHSIDVNLPINKVYNQWTQFEEFPRFMEGVQEVKQKDDTHLHWRAKIAGKEEDWDAEITEQKPDDRIAWKNINGAKNAGCVTFHRISDNVTRIMLQLEYQPDGVVEAIGDLLGFVKRRVTGDLDRFKEYIESRGEETGAWRGQVNRPGEPAHQ